MKTVYPVFAGLVMLAMTGCTTTQKAATTGGLGGAVIGGIIGHQSDNDVAGAAIGGVVGTVGGMIVGQKMEENEEKKFCPECGALFPESETICPTDGTELKLRETGK